MSNKEKIIALLDSLPEYKIGYVLAYVQGITATEEGLSQEPELPYEDRDLI